jgi:hypothetical protein
VVETTTSFMVKVVRSLRLSLGVDVIDMLH